MKTPAETNTSISYNVKNYIKIYLKTEDDVWDLYLMKTIILKKTFLTEYARWELCNIGLFLVDENSRSISMQK